jgi:hypothetical protein
MVFLSRDSRVGVPKSRRLGLLQLWSPITLRADLGSRCSLKQSCSSCRELSNDMLHAPCIQVKNAKLSNDIKNATSHWVLTPEIILWSFGSPPGLHLPKWELPWECEGSLPHTPSHFLTLMGICDVIPGLLLGPHLCNLFVLTLGLPLGLQPCNPFALFVSPKLGLRHNHWMGHSQTWVD